MAAEIINLRRARKAKARQTAEQTAAENRVRFGRSKAKRELDRLENERSHRHLDGTLRGGPAAGAPPDDDSG